MFKSINAIELSKLNSPYIIDIRNREKYNSNHINNSINIPLNQLLIKPEKYLRKDIEYYIYCQKGIQSRKLCLILLNMGYKVVNVTGGYEAWILNE